LNIAFRVDLGFTRGLGHLMRSLSLAERFPQAGTHVSFYIPLNKYASEVIQKNGYLAVQSRDPDRKLLHDLNDQPNSTVITDILYPELKVLAELKKKCLLLVSLDDLGGMYLPSDLVINGSIERRKYPIGMTSVILAGSRYTVMNRKFKARRKERRNYNRKKLSILISLGGSNPNNLMMRVLEILSEMRDKLHIYLVIGPYAKGIKGLLRCAKELIRPRTEIGRAHV
jgi:UDP-2,4-diacetamido-2,4,6-trideoxy-beta-L-altropyranose hydrolase